MSAVAADPRPAVAGASPIPFARIVKVELRKMFNTRSGFWLMASIAIIALIATVSVIIFANDSDMGYGLFATVIGFPMAILLPIVAILSVTSEWSQRTGLTTFTLIPHRGQVISAKAVASIVVGVVSMLLAFAIGAVGNVVGSTIAGVDIVWDVAFSDFLLIIFANVLGLLVGFMLGVLIRNSAGAIVGYFVYSFVLTTIFEVLANVANWFKTIRPWIDFNFAQGKLFDAPVTGKEWANLGTSSIIWLVIPLIIGVWMVLRSEVK
ncbi:MAG: transporter permease [Nocardioidaceae bacterium]|nr:transporter permease [Nocardioidaceae bacterium]